MESLLDFLTQYVEEQHIIRLLGRYAPQIGSARARAELAANALRALGPEASAHVEQLELVLGKVYSCREQAHLLSGISIGLELGRL